jgi:hypothetical protein
LRRGTLLPGRPRAQLVLEDGEGTLYNVDIGVVTRNRCNHRAPSRRAVKIFGETEQCRELAFPGRCGLHPPPGPETRF